MKPRAILQPLAFVLVLGASTSACEPPQDLCGYLDDAIERCNLPSTRLDCSAVEETGKAVLAKRLSDADCKGLADEDDGTAVDPRLCALAGWECPPSPTPAPSGRMPIYPLLLVSGIDASAIFDWHPQIRKRLRDAGVAAHHASVLPWAPTPARTEDLWQSVRSLHERYGAPLHLVCWAVGGLDCRYLVSPHGLFVDDPEQRQEVLRSVASITTIATPHRGTRVAEAALAALKSATAEDLLAAFIGTDVQVPDDATLIRTLEGLTPEALYAFNGEIDDAPEVLYQSWAGVSQVLGHASAADDDQIARHCIGADGSAAWFSHPGAGDVANPLLWVTFPFSGASNDDDGRVVVSPSDGMISVASSKWGEFRGCVPADHYDLVGQIGHLTRDPVTGFDATSLYLKIASDLAERGL